MDAYVVICMLVLCTEIETTEYKLYVTKFLGRCPELGAAKASFEDIKIRYLKSGDASLDFNIVVRQSFSDPLQASWIVERCTSREALDTCSKFATFNTKKFCSLLAGNDKALSSFLRCIRPEYACPIRKFTYTGRNCTFDVKNFFIPLAGSYWKIKIKIVDLRDNSLALCATYEGGVVARQ